MSMAIDVKIVGLDALRADARKAGADADKLIRAALVNSTNKVQSEARSRAPHRTGTLQRSIMPEVSFPDAKVTVNEKYGIYLEQGTGVYGKSGSPIVPKKAKALAFKINGSMVFAMSVKGIKPKPFFQPGVAASVSYIQEQFLKVTERLIQELAGK